jgi:hypothetical protein
VLDRIMAMCDQDGPVAVWARLLEGLRERPEDVMAAVRDRPVRAQVTVRESGLDGAWVYFTANGQVAVMPGPSPMARRHGPHLVLKGSAGEVVSAVLGVTDPFAAAAAGVLVPLAPEVQWGEVLAIVEDVLVAMSDEG